MSFFYHRLDETELSKIIEQKRDETQYLDFKRELHLSRDKEKTELCKDVVAFANSSGGRLIYGVEELKDGNGIGHAENIVPLQEGILKETAENILNSSLNPVPQFQIYDLKVEGGFVLVIDVYSSDTDLYMIRAREKTLYYKRYWTQNKEMEEHEIRRSYLLIGNRIAGREQNEDERIEKIRKIHGSGMTVEEIVVISPLNDLGDIIDARRESDLKVLRAFRAPGGYFIGALSQLEIFSHGFMGTFHDNDRGQIITVSVSKKAEVAVSRQYLGTESPHYGYVYNAYESVDIIIAAYKIMSYCMRLFKIYGEFKILHRIVSDEKFHIQTYEVGRQLNETCFTHKSQPFHSNQMEDEGRKTITNVLDQIWHMNGKATFLKTRCAQTEMYHAQVEKLSL